MPTEIIELSPGRGGGTSFQERPDWSPIAQPPGKDGIIAHTPNPSAYHRSADGRTILPRATKHGASRAFDATRPGVLNIDPTDPLSGRGGAVVDVEQLRRDEALLRQASSIAEGDPLIAWDLVTQGRAERTIEAREAPPMPGYVVPASTTDGRQVTGAGNYAAGVVARGTTAAGAAAQPASVVPVVNPSIHLKENAVEPPQPVPVGPPVPAAQQVAQPAVAPATIPQPIQQAAPQPEPLPQPQVDPTQLAILQVLQGLTEAVGALSNGHSPSGTAPPQQVAQPTPPAPQPVAEHSRTGTPERYDRQAAADEAVAKQSAQRDTSAPKAQMEDFGLGFLHPEPQRPTIKVLFDLGRGGQHLKRFHHVEFTGDAILLIYDDRYEGDRFHPPSTADGERLQVTFPDDENRTYEVLVPPRPRLSFSLGCMDVLMLVIPVDNAPEKQQAPYRQQAPMDQLDQRTDEELRQWRDEIPTQPPYNEAALEQLIRAGQFDAGGAV